MYYSVLFVICRILEVLVRIREVNCHLKDNFVVANNLGVLCFVVAYDGVIGLSKKRPWLGFLGASSGIYVGTIGFAIRMFLCDNYDDIRCKPFVHLMCSLQLSPPHRTTNLPALKIGETADEIECTSHIYDNKNITFDKFVRCGTKWRK